MKKFAIAALLACALVSPAAAGEGNVSNRALSSMGLSGLKVMSDDQGMNVRGMGYAAVSGTGSLNVLGQTRTDSYVAIGRRSATGGNINFVVVGSPWGVVGAASGGIGFARAR